ncbi:MAG: mechanosensitive ion channel domain-containing protein [Halobacteriaceae archaeon]
MTAQSDPISIKTPVQQLLNDILAMGPKIIAGLIFLVIAFLGIKIITYVLRSTFEQIFPGEEIYQQFLIRIISIFLWFGVVLTLLSIVGLQEIALALGTASGFLALGVSYALSGMIADAVAGIYLLRDPDFSPGDTITAGDTKGTIKQIELRKTRFDVDGDTVVRSNAEIEKKWTKAAN